MKPVCTCSTFHFNSSNFCLRGNLPWFCRLLIFFQNQFFFAVVFFYFFVISEECQAVWIQIMPVGSDLGPNCLQRLSAGDTILVSKEFI